ncbi:CMD domain protein [Rhizobium sp. ERR 922]|uniref:CMD domain protein n=1 Tax=Rhizobium TaxID=379 RepID=UPI000DE146FD|nr:MULTISPECIES: CMD domain protein [Rhizobium]MCZ3374701.1 CMD domain protein [Rhizobium sp. AG207R]TWB10874.1 CMD domain protein [Rhizobium sp. ERR1071]TWB48538.1 CMD domain protein [Rhizobium sp. ERR 922]TWB90259.1 CMD domain protein [Rhizobium sp. ERR 942]GES41449.1 CMD domain protein [Rhizobium dioscoreae]
MTLQTRDVIDFLAGIDPGSDLDGLRAQRPETRLNAQKSYEALFEPEHWGSVTPAERLAVAAFVAGLHKAPEIADFYSSKLRDEAHGPELVAIISAELEVGDTTGPYGHYLAGPLSREDRPGFVYEVSGESRQLLDLKLSTALEHSHLLVFRPRDASAAALQKLLDAGWTTTGIVTLSQLVAFLAFQIRVVTGLRALAANPADVGRVAQA